MSFTLTSDELKLVKSGSVDFSLFTDSTKGAYNVTFLDDFSNFLEGVSFTAQDGVDAGFSETEVTTLTQSLENKNAIVGDFSLVNTENIDDLIPISKYLSDCKTKSELEINNNWMWTLTDDFINWAVDNN